MIELIVGLLIALWLGAWILAKVAQSASSCCLSHCCWCFAVGWVIHPEDGSGYRAADTPHVAASDPVRRRR